MLKVDWKLHKLKKGFTKLQNESLSQYQHWYFKQSLWFCILDYAPWCYSARLRDEKGDCESSREEHHRPTLGQVSVRKEHMWTFKIKKLFKNVPAQPWEVICTTWLREFVPQFETFWYLVCYILYLFLLLSYLTYFFKAISIVAFNFSPF